MNIVPNLRNLMFKILIRSQRSFCRTKYRTRCFQTDTKTVNNDNVNTEEMYFGFKRVSPEVKRERVQSIFTKVSSRYDLMNDLMSGGIHRFWKDYFIQVLHPIPGMKLLDVAGGTGDIALRFLQAVNLDSQTEEFEKLNSFFNESDAIESEKNKSNVVVLDLNESMVSICKQRAKEIGVDKDLFCVQGNAENLPFMDNTFDAYTVAFGIRNVVHIEQALSEAFRVLRPGGRFLCLEFSHPRNPLVNKVYDLYSFQAIPVLGQLVTGDWVSYQYLVESIRKFPDQDEFQDMIADANFSLTTYENLCNGIAAIHSGYKI